MAGGELNGKEKVHVDKGPQRSRFGIREIGPLLIVVIIGVVAVTYWLRPKSPPSEEPGPPEFARKTVVISNFDGQMDERGFPFSYSGPQGHQVDFEAVVEDKDEAIKRDGNYLKLRWNLEELQYCGWGIGQLRDKNGLDLTNAESLSMQVLGADGNESFEVKIKDTGGKEASVVSRRYTGRLPQNTWTELVIPFKDFEQQEANLASIENVSIGISLPVSGKSGMIFIDDIKLVLRVSPGS